MGDETMRLSAVQEGAASAADIQKPFPARSIFAGAKIEEANMIRNNKLPVRLFQAMEQPRESASRNRFVRPPIFCRDKTRRGPILPGADSDRRTRTICSEKDRMSRAPSRINDPGPGNRRRNPECDRWDIRRSPLLLLSVCKIHSPCWSQTKTESFHYQKTEVAKTIAPGLQFYLSHPVGVINVDFFESNPLPDNGFDLDLLAESHAIAYELHFLETGAFEYPHAGLRIPDPSEIKNRHGQAQQLCSRANA